MQDNNEIKTCCICGQVFIGWGNNPEPVAKDGECCSDCNANRVIPARLKQMMRRTTSEK